MIDTNSIGAQCPLVTLETVHTLFITATLFILSNNVYPNTFALSESDAGDASNRFGPDEARSQPTSSPSPRPTMARAAAKVKCNELRGCQIQTINKSSI